MFISGHFHALGMRRTRKHISCVAIGKLERQVRTVSNCGTSNNRNHPIRSLYYCLFASHICVCSSRTSRAWWIALSTQRQLTGCNNIPSFLQWTTPIARSFGEGCTWNHHHILATAPLCCNWKTRTASEHCGNKQIPSGKRALWQIPSVSEYCGSKQQYRSHVMLIYFYLFAPHIYGCCSSRTCRSWWIAHSTQC